MPTVFINYRSGDDAYAAALLDILLSSMYGTKEVFRASRSIEPGSNYMKSLISGINSSRVMLAMIGPNWCESFARTEVDAEVEIKDWVVEEISQAFRAGVTVIPILLYGARRPDEHALPGAIKELAHCQYLRLDYRNIESDFLYLTQRIEQYFEYTLEETNRVGVDSVRLDNAAILGLIHGLGKRIDQLEERSAPPE